MFFLSRSYSITALESGSEGIHTQIASMISFNAKITDQSKSYKETELQLEDLLYPSALSRKPKLRESNKIQGLKQQSRKRRCRDGFSEPRKLSISPEHVSYLRRSGNI